MMSLPCTSTWRSASAVIACAGPPLGRAIRSNTAQCRVASPTSQAETAMPMLLHQATSRAQMRCRDSDHKGRYWYQTHCREIRHRTRGDHAPRPIRSMSMTSWGRPGDHSSVKLRASVLLGVQKPRRPRTGPLLESAPGDAPGALSRTCLDGRPDRGSRLARHQGPTPLCRWSKNQK